MYIWIVAIVIRLVLPPVVLKSPWWGMVLLLLVDWFDLEIIKWTGTWTGTDISFAFYQRYDKLLDLYMFSWSMVPVWRMWDMYAKQTATVLFLFRLVGVVLFEFTGLRYLLLMFPNVYEFFYIAVAYSKWKDESFAFVSQKQPWLLALYLLVPKLVEEYAIHINEARVMAHLKHDLLHWPKTPFDRY